MNGGHSLRPSLIQIVFNWKSFAALRPTTSVANYMQIRRAPTLPIQMQICVRESINEWGKLFKTAIQVFSLIRPHKEAAVYSKFCLFDIRVHMRLATSVRFCDERAAHMALIVGWSVLAARGRCLFSWILQMREMCQIWRAQIGSFMCLILGLYNAIEQESRRSQRSSLWGGKERNRLSSAHTRRYNRCDEPNLSP